MKKSGICEAMREKPKEKPFHRYVRNGLWVDVEQRVLDKLDYQANMG